MRPELFAVRRRCLLAVLSGLALWGCGPATAHIADVAGDAVTITVKLGRGGSGTFAISGAPTESGRVRVTRKVSGGRLATTQQLVGRYGSLVVSSSQRCAARTGTWKVVSGGGAYAGAAGGGTARGRGVCRRPSTVVLSGQLTAPQLAEPPSYAKPSLAVATDYTDKGGPVTEDSADFNGDGFVDVVLTRADWPATVTYPMLVLRNNGHGRFVDGTASIFEGSPPRLLWPRKLVIADFNNDGRPDIFVADHGYDGEPGPGFHNTLVLSTADGRLRDATANLPPRIRFTHSATAADVNRDGAVDLYIGSIYTTARKEPPEIFFNDGTGTFRPCAECLPGLVTRPVIVDGVEQGGYSYTASQFVDVNKDGAVDLVLAGNGFYRLPTQIVSSDSQVLLNDGTGHFSVLSGALPPRPWNDTAEGHDVRTADLNADGFPDLAIAYTRMDPLGVGRYVQLLINNGNGTFRDETQARLPQPDNQSPAPLQVSFADLNGDAAPDLVVELTQGVLEPTPFYLNDGTGRFQPLPTGFGNIIQNNMAPVDLMSDGHRDFVTTDGLAYPVINHYVVREVGAPRRPGTPSGVRVTRDPASGQLVVAWPYVWGAARYEVWRSTGSGGSVTKIATTRLMRYVDMTATAGVAYTFAIRAVNGSGSSKLSEAVAGPAR